MKEVAVFQFKVFSIAEGNMVAAPRYATLDAIKLANGVPIVATKQLVPETELDENGFHKLTIGE